MTVDIIHKAPDWKGPGRPAHEALMEHMAYMAATLHPWLPWARGDKEEQVPESGQKSQ